MTLVSDCHHNKLWRPIVVAIIAIAILPLPLTPSSLLLMHTWDSGLDVRAM